MQFQQKFNNSSDREWVQYSVGKNEFCELVNEVANELFNW